MESKRNRKYGKKKKEGSQLASGRHEIVTVELYFVFLSKERKKILVDEKQILTYTYVKENDSTFGQ